MFVQKLNPLTGEADWVLVNDPGLGDEDDASADLVATSSYLDMLTDTRRNAAYHAALRRVIPAKQRAAAAARTTAAEPPPPAAAPAAGNNNDAAAAAANGGNGSSDSSGGVRVLDIGTGTGLLAMMAARLLASGDAAAVGRGAVGSAVTPAGADAPPSAPVIACEVFPPMQNLARRVIASNGLGDVIRVVNKRSDEIVVQQPGEAAAAAAKQAAMSAAAAARAARVAAAAGGATGPDMYGRADVVVTEIFDSELLGEGMIPTMRHAVQHLLKEGGVVIPATSRVYGQLIQCPLMHHMTGLRPAPGSGGVSGGSRTDPGRSGGDGGDGPAATATAAAANTASTATAATAAADRVLAALGELDERARAGFYGSEDLYEVREMHVDLLHQHAEARHRRPETTTHGSPPGAPPPAQQQQQPSQVAAAAAAAPSEATASTAKVPEVGEEEEGEPLLRPLSEPFLVFDFDWLRPPPPAGRRKVLEVPVSLDGSAHAVLLWWQLGMTPPEYDTAVHQQPQLQPQQQQQQQQLQQQPQEVQPTQEVQPPPLPMGDGGHPLLLSTAPVWLEGRAEAGGDGGRLAGVAQQWRDHWKQCWVQLADDTVAVRQGDILRLSFEHDDLNIRSKLLPTAAAPPPPQAPPAPAAGPPAAAAEAASGGEAAAAAASSARERLAALQAEADEDAATQQQLMPLLSWLGPLALLQLGDQERLRTFGTALQAALEEAGAAAADTTTTTTAAAPTATAAAAAAAAGGAEVVVVDGSLALGLLAAIHPAVSSVTLLQEDNLAAQNWLRAAARHLGVAAAKIKSVRSETYFKRLRAAGGGGAAAAAAGPLVLVSEPYFSEFEQLVPWAHLRFWRDYDVIRGSSATRGGRRVAAFPRRARLMAVAAALPELWRTRNALGHVEGLDLAAANVVLGVVGAEEKDAGKKKSRGGDDDNGAAAAADDDGDVWGEDEGDADADTAGQGDSAGGGGGGGGGRQPLPILPYSVWQAGGGYEELSPRQEVLALDCGGHLDDVEGAATLTATHGSMCHAIVLWLEYDLAPSALEQRSRRSDDKKSAMGQQGSGGDGLVVGSAPAADGGPTATVQGVYLLRQPVQMTRGSRLHVAAQFDGLDADVSVEVTVLPPLTH